jgi:hypothetical protein
VGVRLVGREDLVGASLEEQRSSPEDGLNKELSQYFVAIVD